MYFRVMITMRYIIYVYEIIYDSVNVSQGLNREALTYEYLMYNYKKTFNNSFYLLRFDFLTNYMLYLAKLFLPTYTSPLESFSLMVIILTRTKKQ